MRNTRLSTRGLILVGFPLLCQIAFVATLTILLWNLQTSILQSCASRKLVVDMHQYLMLSAEHIPDVGITTSESQWQSQRKRGIVAAQLNGADLGALLRRVRDVLGNDDPQLNNVVSAKQGMEEEINSLTGSSVWPWKSTSRASNDIHHIGKLINSFIGNWSLLAEKVTDRQLKQTEHYRAELQNLFCALTIALAASVVIALALWWLYTSTIIRPLLGLIENSRRLAANQDLLPEENTKDEIGHFDSVLHQASRAFNATLKREKAIVDRAAAMICVADELGVIKEANSYSNRLLGIPPEEFIGRLAEEFVIPEQVLVANTKLNEARRSKEPEAFELKLLKPDGVVLDTRWSCFRAKKGSDLFCVVQDITSEKNIERMKQEFVDMVSHDLSVPLEAILDSLTQIVEHKPAGLSQAAADEIMSVKDSASILVAMINNLLDFQKMQTQIELTVSQERLENIIEEAAALVRNSIQLKGLTLSLPHGTYPLSCDRNMVLQTITNLLVNAIKYSPDDGTIAVDIVETNDKLNVYVVDEGPGVPAEFRDKIFSPFEQVPNSREGVGLGLAICKLNVEAHGGTIGVTTGGVPYSEKHRKGIEKGSCFWFTLPRVARGSSKSSL